jgi:hypothetical protein
MNSIDVLNLIQSFKCVKQMQYHIPSFGNITVNVVIDINRVEKGSDVNRILSLLKNNLIEWELIIKS